MPTATPTPTRTATPTPSSSGTHTSSALFEDAWALGSTGTEESRAIGTDIAGNIFVAGRFQGSVNFNPNGTAVTINSAGGTFDAFAAKYTAAGVLIWVQRIGGSEGDDAINGMAVDGAGNAYVAGRYVGNANFQRAGALPASFPLFSGLGGSDGFLMKFDPIGGAPIATQIGGPLDDSANAVTITAGGDFLVTGAFQNQTSSPFNLNSAGSSDTFVAKWSSGRVQWAKALGGAGSDVGQAITTSGTHVFVTGSFRGTADFDPDAGRQDRTSSGDVDVYITALNFATGAFAWTTSLGSNGADVGQGIATDGTSVYTTGSYAGSVGAPYDLSHAGGSDIFVTKHAAASGTLEWVKGLGGAGDDDGASLQLDQTGRLYLAGSFAGSVDLDPDGRSETIVSAGGSDAFVSQFDAAGTFLDGFSMGGPNNDKARNLAESEATILTTGSFTGTANFNPGAGSAKNLGSTSGSADIFVSRTRIPAPTLPRLALGLGSGHTNEGLATGTDIAGNMFVAGRFQGSVNFNPNGTAVTINSAGGTFDAFAAKYTAAGVLVWVQRIGGSEGDDAINGMAVDGAGNAYVAGRYVGNASFQRAGALPASFPLFSGLGGSDGFLMKFDPNGDAPIATQIGGPLDDSANAVTITTGGDFLISGAFQDHTDSPFILNSAGGSDAFVARWRSGRVLWAKVLGGAGSDTSHAIATSGTNVFVTGSFSGTADFDPDAGRQNRTSSGDSDVYMTALDFETGAFAWTTSLGSNGADLGQGIATDGTSVYTTGSYAGSIGAPYNLSHAGGSDIFVTKHAAASGTLEWVKRLGGAGDDDGADLQLDQEGNVYTVGSFDGPVDFDPSTGVQELAGIGGSDVFVSKLNDDGEYLDAQSFGGTGLDTATSLSLKGPYLFMTGAFSGTADFSLDAEDQLRLSSAGTDIFLSRNALITIGPPTLRAGSRGTAYNQMLTGIGGNGGPYVFALRSGALPSGLALSAGGSISGTPTISGTFTLTVSVSDGTVTQDRKYVLVIN